MPEYDPQMHSLRPLEHTPTTKKPIFVKQITCASLQLENPIQTDTSGVGNIQMATKHN